MCLENLMDKEALKEFKKGLPHVLSVWKVVDADGSCEYDGRSVGYYFNKNEQKLDKRGVYFARSCPCRRAKHLSYRPGFHAFLSVEDAERYLGLAACKKVAKFRAKRTWIREIGWTEGRGIRSVVLSRIEVS